MGGKWLLYQHYINIYNNTHIYIYIIILIYIYIYQYIYIYIWRFPKIEVPPHHPLDQTIQRPQQMQDAREEHGRAEHLGSASGWEIRRRGAVFWWWFRWNTAKGTLYISGRCSIAMPYWFQKNMKWPYDCLYSIYMYLPWITGIHWINSLENLQPSFINMGCSSFLGPQISQFTGHVW